MSDLHEGASEYTEDPPDVLSSANGFLNMTDVGEEAI